MRKNFRWAGRKLSFKCTTTITATNYSIRVLAFTSTGDGLHSIPVYCSTDEDVPEAPANIKASALTAESILISWLTPIQRNGLITHYTVYSKDAGRKGQTRSELRIVAGVSLSYDKCEVLEMGNKNRN